MQASLYHEAAAGPACSLSSLHHQLPAVQSFRRCTEAGDDLEAPWEDDNELMPSASEDEDEDEQALQRTASRRRGPKRRLAAHRQVSPAVSLLRQCCAKGPGYFSSLQQSLAPAIQGRSPDIAARRAHHTATRCLIAALPVAAEQAVLCHMQFAVTFKTSTSAYFKVMLLSREAQASLREHLGPVRQQRSSTSTPQQQGERPVRCH